MSFDSESLTREKVNITFAKNWEVIFFNDDTTPQNFVVEVLASIFKYNYADAYKITKQIEKESSLVVAVLPKKLAAVRVRKTRELAKEYNFKDFRVELKEED